MKRKKTLWVILLVLLLVLVFFNISRFSGIMQKPLNTPFQINLKDKQNVPYNSPILEPATSNSSIDVNIYDYAKGVVTYKDPLYPLGTTLNQFPQGIAEGLYISGAYTNCITPYDAERRGTLQSILGTEACKKAPNSLGTYGSKPCPGGVMYKCYMSILTINNPDKLFYTLTNEYTQVTGNQFITKSIETADIEYNYPLPSGYANTVGVFFIISIQTQNGILKLVPRLRTKSNVTVTLPKITYKWIGNNEIGYNNAYTLSNLKVKYIINDGKEDLTGSINGLNEVQTINYSNRDNQIAVPYGNPVYKVEYSVAGNNGAATLSGTITYDSNNPFFIIPTPQIKIMISIVNNPLGNILVIYVNNIQNVIVVTGTNTTPAFEIPVGSIVKVGLRTIGPIYYVDPINTDGINKYKLATFTPGVHF